MRKSSGMKFTDIANIGYQRDTENAKHLAGYKKTADYNSSHYLEHIAKDMNSDLRFSTKNSIAATDKKAREDALKTIEELREILHVWVVEPAPERLITQLKIAKDFGLKLSKVELEAYASQTNGNYTALRCVADLAKQSGYRLAFPTLEDFEKDLAVIDGMFAVPSHVAPSDLIHEAIVCASDKMYRGISYGPPKAYDITYSSSMAESRPNKLKEMAERWDAAIQYTIEKVEDEEGKEVNVVSPAEEQKATPGIATAEDATNAPEARAAQIGKDRAEANAEAERVLALYT